MDSYRYCPSLVYDSARIGSFLWWIGENSKCFVCADAMFCNMLHRVCGLGGLWIRLAFTGSGSIIGGTDAFFLLVTSQEIQHQETLPESLFVVFQMDLCWTTPALVVDFAERMRFSTCASLLFYG